MKYRALRNIRTSGPARGKKEGREIYVKRGEIFEADPADVAHIREDIEIYASAPVATEGGEDKGGGEEDQGGKETDD